MNVTGILLAVFGLLSGWAFGRELAPFIDDKQQAEIERILTISHRGQDLEALEMRYHQLVQRQLFADLADLYSPRNAGRIQITYPSFAPAGGRPDLDLGYGLHVVKRLQLPLPGGSVKVIDVNEAWAENPTDGGLFLPDEIRIKSRVVDGPRFVPGSERQYLFDSIRLAWGPAGEIAIVRRTRFTYDARAGINRLKQMRVPVSSPYSCRSCHGDEPAFADRFLQPGERRNNEAIVQDSQFLLPVEKMPGYLAYADHLRRRGVTAARIAATLAALRDPPRATAIPGLLALLQSDATSGQFAWIGEDDGVYEPAIPESLLLQRQGSYRDERGGLWFDALEGVFEGKYRWWEPYSVIPAG